MEQVKEIGGPQEHLFTLRIMHGRVINSTLCEEHLTGSQVLTSYEVEQGHIMVTRLDDFGE